MTMAIDRVRLDPGGNEIVAQHAGRGRDLAAGAGVDQNELVAGIDDQRRERRRQFVVRHEGRIERMLHFGERRVADEFVGDRPVPDAVIERGQLVRADLVAIDAGRLFVGGGAAAAAGSAPAAIAAAAVPASTCVASLRAWRFSFDRSLSVAGPGSVRRYAAADLDAGIGARKLNKAGAEGAA